MNAFYRRTLIAACLILIIGQLSLNGAVDKPKSPPPIRVLLLGDSTCIGSVCRTVEPHADHLEQVIEKLLAAEKDLPPVQVINKGRDGEFIRRLLTSGRYDREIGPLKDIDFVFVRYGPNDKHNLTDFPHQFPDDIRALLGRLRKDYPKASLILMTMIPLYGDKGDHEVNDLVYAVAAEQKLPVCDIHTRYAAEQKFGPHMLSYRRMPLKEIPERFHLLVADFVQRDGTVVVLDNRLDVHLRGVPGWFRDQHPNLAGYHVIGDETAKFLAPLIRDRVRK